MALIDEFLKGVPADQQKRVVGLHLVSVWENLRDSIAILNQPDHPFVDSIRKEVVEAQIIAVQAIERGLIDQFSLQFAGIAERLKKLDLTRETSIYRNLQQAKHRYKMT